ncbi:MULTISPECIES: V-type ATP synthase subunit I [unclassified Ruminococcus]|uniref:V-type ATP synthase subunit I n=1 Tax=unclassified Ruminococcus TaxID=2608920 RepID=UPI002109C7B7|nr:MULTISPECIES: V-type ATP synthase subunit I [unclassified Ruminococcus]MCQ4022640.1 V-type ATP synthase subunit I [Ruminococcus sp. zg-924]MCQ4114880.1 V-type ATP synthase subunit I [Ruminococcus sp. zg-921]
MSVVKMQQISICALKTKRKAIMEALQRRGVIEISPLEYDGGVFVKEETAQQQSLFMKNSATAAKAYEILLRYFPEKSSMLDMFKGRDQLSTQQYYSLVSRSIDVMREANSVIALDKGLSEKRADIAKYEYQIEALLPWKSLDISMRFKGTDSSAAFIGTFPELLSYEQILMKIAEQNPNISSAEVEVISSSKEMTCVFIICKKSEQAFMEEALRKIGYSAPSVVSKYPPAERILKLKERIKNLEKGIADDEEKIKAFEKSRDTFKFMEDYYVMRAEKYGELEKLVNTRHTFFLKGYISEKDAQPLVQYLSQTFDAVVECQDIPENEEIPIVLKNNVLTQPVESVLETYSMPKRYEFDPTGIMAIFYYIFFGMMFSDAGYGLVMTIACAIVLLKFKNMEDGLKKSIKMFFFCGISTTFWGAMYGSFFGDAITVIGKTFFNADWKFPALWFDPIQGTNSMTLLMFCFLFGIIHIFVGLGISGYMSIKNGKPLDAVFDVLSWYLLVGGGILALLSMDMLKSMTGFTLPPIFLTIGGVCALIGALIILFFSGRGSKPVKRLLKGIYGVYGVTSYLSDILSYSRLLALGLATGVIAQVFNQIGSMFGGGFGVIPFIIVFLIGHTLNIGINALGAYVHTNRLQFVEFFGKFYEGGGEKFAPFKINTKHYNIKEDINNG